MAHWVQRGDDLTLTEEDIELASRLLPEVCRTDGEEQQRRDTEVKPPPSPIQPAAKPSKRKSGVAAIPANTMRHSLWQEIRAEALRQKPRRERDGDSEERIEWTRKWRISAADRANPSSHVITVNVGPRGLQICLEHLPATIGCFDTLPMVVHLQDVRITRRRFRTMQEHVKRLLPDYTIYAQLNRGG